MSDGYLRLRNSGACPPAGRAARFRVGGGERCRKYSGRAEQSDRLPRRSLHWGSLRISWGDRPAACESWALAVEEEEREEGVRTQTHSGSVFEEADCGGDGTVRNQVLGTGLRGSGLGEDAAVETRAPEGLRGRGQM